MLVEEQVPSNLGTWLHERGFGLDLRSKDAEGKTPMFVACGEGDLEVAKYLFKLGAKDDIRVRDSFGNTPMLEVCARGHLGVAQWLLDVGAAKDIQRRTASRRTPLHWACLGGHVDVAQWLIDEGCAGDLRATDAYGCTPLRWACIGGLINMAMWLILHGACKNDLDGRADPAILERDVPHNRRKSLSVALRRLISEAGYQGLVLISPSKPNMQDLAVLVQDGQLGNLIDAAAWLES